MEPVPWPKNIKVFDVRRGLPFPTGTVVAIFSSHMLEHISFEAGDFVIKECSRVLCKGGVIRIIVPDLMELAKRYLDLMINDPKGRHSYDFLRGLNLHLHDEPHKGILKIAYKFFNHNVHKSMYDEWSLRDLLEKHGFCKIERMSYGQSRIPDIKIVEDKGRHESSVCLEGVKE